MRATDLHDKYPAIQNVAPVMQISQSNFSEVLILFFQNEVKGLVNATRPYCHFSVGLELNSKNYIMTVTEQHNLLKKNYTKTIPEAVRVLLWTEIFRV